MIRIVWAPQAIQDVEARVHIARDSTHYADLAVERIIAAVERLADHPRSGRVVLSSATSHSERSCTATIGSSTACDRTLSRSRRSSMELVSFDSTDGRDLRASNFGFQPTAARFARCGG